MKVHGFIVFINDYFDYSGEHHYEFHCTKDESTALRNAYLKYKEFCGYCAKNKHGQLPKHIDFDEFSKLFTEANEIKVYSNILEMSIRKIEEEMEE